jgi:hypothetical protein
MDWTCVATPLFFYMQEWRGKEERSKHVLQGEKNVEHLWHCRGGWFVLKIQNVNECSSVKIQNDCMREVYKLQSVKRSVQTKRLDEEVYKL